MAKNGHFAFAPREPQTPFSAVSYNNNSKYNYVTVVVLLNYMD